jgi:catechol 2,3-dioxygenase
MAVGKVSAVRSVTLGVPDLPASLRFYSDIWGLTPVAERDGMTYLRGTGPYHHLLALAANPRAQVLGIDLLADDRAMVEALHQSVVGSEATGVTVPGNLTQPGGGYGFTFNDPEGRAVTVVTGDQRHAELPPDPDRPAKITHAVLNSADMDGASAFYCERLGFQQINRIERMCFLKCNVDHHSLAFARGTASTLNHLAFAMKDVAAVARGAQRMLAHGYPIGWGVGQHTAGEDVYAYFEGPEGGGIEYITKVPPGWQGSTDNTAHWDVALRPTEKQAAAMRRIPFSAARG